MLNCWFYTDRRWDRYIYKAGVHPEAKYLFYLENNVILRLLGLVLKHVLKEIHAEAD